MLVQMKSVPKGIDAVKASGKVTLEDYESVFVPMLNEARVDGRRLRFLYQFGPDFEGFTAGAAWDDLRLGLRAMRRFDGCAVVTDHAWISDATKLAGLLMPCPVKVFTNRDLEPALAWLCSLPELSAMSFHLLPNQGVVVVEVGRPLRAQDFDALALLVDPWIEAHGHLAGIVIHARKFPGWESFAGALHHMRFVRDHQAKVERIALAADGELASLAPAIADVLLQANVRSFRFDQLEAAVAWAGERKAAPAAAAPERGSERPAPPI